MNSMKFLKAAGFPAVLLAAALAAGTGCSTSNNEAVVLTPQGSHAAGWVEAHPDFARPDGSACAPCHGSVSDPADPGGIAKVSCFSESRGAQSCHGNGPAFHPAVWLDKGGADFHGNAFLAGTLVRGKACSVCHNEADPPSFICLDCHFSIDGQRVPNGSNYVHGEVAGHTVFGQLDVLNDNNAVCIRCHETNNTFGHMPQPLCHNCHSPAPPGFHPAGWADPDSHGASAKLAPGAGATTGFPTCQTCHGANLDGVGGSAPSCVNNPACHGTGVASPHSPTPWRAPLTARTHTETVPDNRNAAVCARCHFGGVTQPPAPPPAGSNPGCFNGTLCHAEVGAAPHPVRPFQDHPTRARNEFDTFCNTCHDVGLPRKLSTAPSCVECHKGGSPFTFTNCTSCHGSPPNGAAPVGGVFPNIEGAHAEHNALAGITGICNTCHNGGGNGTGLNHFYDNAAGQSGINVALAATTYQAKAGAFLFNVADNSCSNVSCHGGIRTPTWGTGAIDVNADAGCAQCHRRGTALGVPENNSHYSGQHARSEHISAGCTACHNTAKLADPAVGKHFANLATAAFDTRGSVTIGGGTTKVQTYVPGLNVGTGTCTPLSGVGCHGSQSW